MQTNRKDTSKPAYQYAGERQWKVSPNNNLSSLLILSTKRRLMSQIIAWDSTNVKLRYNKKWYLLNASASQKEVHLELRFVEKSIYTIFYFYNLLFSYLKLKIVTQFPLHFQHNMILIQWNNFITLHSIYVFWCSPSLFQQSFRDSYGHKPNAQKSFLICKPY